MYERMLNKQAVPTIEEMTEYCGENAESFSLLNEMFVITIPSTSGSSESKRHISGWELLLVCAVIKYTERKAEVFKGAFYGNRNYYMRLERCGKEHIGESPCRETSILFYRQ